MNRVFVFCVAVLSGWPLVGATGQTGVLQGRVLRDSTEQPVGGASVQLPGLRRQVTSDSLGRYRAGDLPVGRHQVLVHRTGYEAAVGEVEIGPSDTVEADFLLVPATQLAPVSVRVAPIPRALREFVGRRALGIGHFLDSTAIAAAPGSRLSEKVRPLPGIVLQYGRGTVVTVHSSRGGAFASTCPAEIRVNGLVADRGALNSYQPDEVLALEWYAGPSQVPAQYGGTKATCALLVL